MKLGVLLVNLFAVLLAVMVLGSGCMLLPNPAPELSRPETIRLMTYNVLKSNPEPAATAGLIRNLDADIVCLQETDPAWEAVLRECLGDAYPYAFWSNAGWESRHGGQSLLSRYPLRETRVLGKREVFFPAQFVIAETPLGDVQILNVHLHPCVHPKNGGGGYRAYRATRDDRVRELNDYLPALNLERAAVVLGDWNDFPFSPVTKRAYSLGLKSALRERRLNTHTCVYRFGGLWLGAQIDHVMFTEPLKCVSAKVVKKGSSDHRPVVVEFGI